MKNRKRIYQLDIIQSNNQFLLLFLKPFLVIWQGEGMNEQLWVL